jgi:hypothetical protein
VCQEDERRQGEAVADLQERVADSAAALSLTLQRGRGNAGPVERVENQTQVSHSSHRPLEISQTPRDFHIPTAQASTAWKSGKPKTGFPLSHTVPATTTTVSLSPNPNPKERKSAAARPLHPPNFQDHLVLESKPGFRIILGLEYAV